MIYHNIIMSFCWVIRKKSKYNNIIILYSYIPSLPKCSRLIKVDEPHVLEALMHPNMKFKLHDMIIIIIIM